MVVTGGVVTKKDGGTRLCVDYRRLNLGICIFDGRTVSLITHRCLGGMIHTESIWTYVLNHIIYRKHWT